MNTGSHQDDEGLEAFRTRADRILLAALAAHVVASLCVALWNGSWVPALVLAVPAAIVPALIYRLAPGALVTRLAVAASFMVLTGVLIHQVQGELEAHFGVFVLLALLVLYCDWRPIVMAAAVIAVHHVGFAWMQSAGVAVFVLGMAVNVHSDEVLRGLRRPGERGYAVPRGGLFRWVSCPNYLGEMVEWSGFALAVWNLPALSFAAWSVANLLPRALAHHRWYRARFADYPSERRAVVPWVL